MTSREEQINIAARAMKPNVQRVDMMAPGFDPDDRSTWTLLPPAEEPGRLLRNLAEKVVDALIAAGELEVLDG